jgi:hypothetical protein
MGSFKPITAPYFPIIIKPEMSSNDSVNYGGLTPSIPGLASTSGLRPGHDVNLPLEHQRHDHRAANQGLIQTPMCANPICEPRRRCTAYVAETQRRAWLAVRHSIASPLAQTCTGYTTCNQSDELACRAPFNRVASCRNQIAGHLGRQPETQSYLPQALHEWTLCYPCHAHRKHGTHLNPNP